MGMLFCGVPLARGATGLSLKQLVKSRTASKKTLELLETTVRLDCHMTPLEVSKHSVLQFPCSRIHECTDVC